MIIWPLRYSLPDLVDALLGFLDVESIDPLVVHLAGQETIRHCSEELLGDGADNKRRELL